LKWLANAKIANEASDALELVDQPEDVQRLNTLYTIYSSEAPNQEAAYISQKEQANQLRDQLASSGVNVQAIETSANEEISSSLKLCIDLKAIIDTEVQARTQYKTQGDATNGEGEIVGSQTDVVGASQTASVEQDDSKHSSFLSRRGFN